MVTKSGIRAITPIEEQTGAADDEVYILSKKRLAEYLQFEAEEAPSEILEKQMKAGLTYIVNHDRRWATSRAMASTQYRVYQFIYNDPKEIEKRMKASAPNIFK